MAVPTLDLSHYIAGSQQQRQEFSLALLDSFERTGFAKLKAHTFSHEQLSDMFGWAHTFFDQSMEAKMEIPNKKGPRPMRGYTGYRIEEVGKLHQDAKVRAMTDSKEHFDQGQSYDTEFPNQWPPAPEMAAFKPFMEAFYQQCDDVCLTLMTALEVAWGIDDGSLVACCQPSSADLRLTNYPEISLDEMQGNTSRIAPHTDFGPITLLFQDGTGGLEIEDRTQPGPNPTFVPLPPIDTHEMIVNVDDTLTRWTNGKILGGIHQVMAPEAMKGKSGLMIPSRISMAYLFKAERNMSVGPSAKFITPECPALYPDVTALEFQRWKNSIVYNLDGKLGLDGQKKVALEPVAEVVMADKDKILKRVDSAFDLAITASA